MSNFKQKRNPSQPSRSNLALTTNGFPILNPILNSGLFGIRDVTKFKDRTRIQTERRLFSLLPNPQCFVVITKGWELDQFDQSIYVAVMATLAEHYFESTTIPVLDVIRKMGLPGNQPAYKRVANSLHRLSHTAVKIKSKLYKNAKSNKAGLYDCGGYSGTALLAVEWNSEKKGRLASVSVPNEWRRWYIAGNSGYVDHDVYGMLNNPLQRRLYLFLCGRKRVYKHSIPISDLLKLFYQVVPTGESSIWKFRFRLRKAVDVLEMLGLINEVNTHNNFLSFTNTVWSEKSGMDFDSNGMDFDSNGMDFDSNGMDFDSNGMETSRNVRARDKLQVTSNKEPNQRKQV